MHEKITKQLADAAEKEESVFEDNIARRGLILLVAVDLLPPLGQCIRIRENSRKLPKEETAP